MEITSNVSRSILDHEKVIKELKEFDETKTGVRGLIDSGVVKIPRIFICPPDSLAEATCNNTSKSLQVPIISLEGFENIIRRSEIVDEVRTALQTWGFFQIVNHGMPISVMDNALESIKQFHEQPKESRMEFYSRDNTRKVKYYSNGDLYLTKTAQWRDSLSCDFDDSNVDLESLPQVCRKAIGDYMNGIIGIRNVLSELLSEALGLDKDHLDRLDCLGIQRLLCHYYPPCPEPELTLGIMKHSDPYFLTILLQDNIGGLQVLHENQWVDVPPLQGSLIVNAGDLLQLITNDKFKSVEHRVKAGLVGPRISTACFLYPSNRNQSKPYGPLKELLSDNSLPMYRETNFIEFIRCYASKGLDGQPTLKLFKNLQA